MEGIADALNNVFGDPEVQKSMRDGFINAKAIGENLTRLTGSMADIAEANKGEINEMVSNMNAMTIRMNGVAAHLESIVLRLMPMALPALILPRWRGTWRIPAARCRKFLPS
jgi:phospholipid/cholesterol/gamma-HCH transport system substrate-binding protein